jgi:hypothetical protein
MPPKLQPEDEQLLQTATALLNNRSYEDAKQLLDARVAKGLNTADSGGVLLLARIAGLLIDIGSEGHLEEAIQDGLALHENHREHFNGLFTPASAEYTKGKASTMGHPRSKEQESRARCAVLAGYGRAITERMVCLLGKAQRPRAPIPHPHR